MQNLDPYRPCPCGSGKKFKFCCLQKQRERASRGENLIFPALQVKSARGLASNTPVLVGDLDELVFICGAGKPLASAL